MALHCIAVASGCTLFAEAQHDDTIDRGSEEDTCHVSMQGAFHKCWSSSQKDAWSGTRRIRARRYRHVHLCFDLRQVEAALGRAGRGSCSREDDGKKHPLDWRSERHELA